MKNKVKVDLSYYHKDDNNLKKYIEKLQEILTKVPEKYRHLVQIEFNVEDYYGYYEVGAKIFYYRPFSPKELSDIKSKKIEKKYKERDEELELLQSLMEKYKGEIK